MNLAKPLPKGTEYLIPVIEKIGAQAGVSPFLLLGILYAESNFGLALKPKGPTGSGDFIPRPANADRDARMKTSPLPGVERRTLPDGIPARKIAGPVEAWVPTTNGWGCGLFQIDYEAHFPFAKSGAWADPEKACAYAAGILNAAKATITKAHPKLTPAELLRATVASYNAGAGRVVRALSAGRSLDAVTFHPNYVGKIIGKANELAGASVI